MLKNLLFRHHKISIFLWILFRYRWERRFDAATRWQWWDHNYTVLEMIARNTDKRIHWKAEFSRGRFAWGLARKRRLSKHLDLSKQGAFGRMKNRLPPCAGKARPADWVNSRWYTNKTQKEGCSQKRALKKGWESPSFIVNRESTLEN